MKYQAACWSKRVRSLGSPDAHSTGTEGRMSPLLSLVVIVRTQSRPGGSEGGFLWNLYKEVEVVNLMEELRKPHALCLALRDVS